MKLDYKFTAIRNYCGHSFLIDSCHIPEEGLYELMIFPLNKVFEECREMRYNVDDRSETCIIDDVYDNVDWLEIYCVHYDCLEDAEEDFERIIDDFEGQMNGFVDVKITNKYKNNA